MDSFPMEAVMKRCFLFCSWDKRLLKGYSEEEKEMKPVLFEKITYAVAETAKMLGISKGAA